MFRWEIVARKWDAFRRISQSGIWWWVMVGANQNQVLILPFFKDIFALKMRICWATRWSVIRIICCLLTARNSDSNQTFPVTKQNTLALIIGMKFSFPDSIFPKVDCLEAWKFSLQFFRFQFEQWHWWFFYKSVIGHGSILCLIQKKLPDLECICEHKAYPFSP